MLKKLDLLYHFTTDLNNVESILSEGFSPSYANESFGPFDIKVPMVSFSNILLRDVGENEVLQYGHYAIGLSRDWAIKEEIHPVTYSYDKGHLFDAILGQISNSIFLSRLDNYEEILEKFSKTKGGPISKFMKLEGLVSQEAADTLDYLSENFSQKLLALITAQNKNIISVNDTLILLSKPYRVKNNKGQEFIAYNDREWRKIYKDLSYLREGSSEFEKWSNTPKPHLTDEKYRLKFNLNDIKNILIKDKSEMDRIITTLQNKFEKAAVEEAIAKKQLIIGTQKELEKEDF